MSFFDNYQKHIDNRALQNVPPLPLNAQQMDEIVALLSESKGEKKNFLVDLLTNRVPPGVDDAAYIKAGFLSAIALNKTKCPFVTKKKAIKLLGTMLGGYNIQPLIELLDDSELGEIAADQLKNTLLMFDAFYDVEEKAKQGNENAIAVLQSWADAEWFLKKSDLPSEIKLMVFN